MILPVLAGALHWPPRLPLWVMSRDTPQHMAEGEDLVLGVQCFSGRANRSALIWKLAGARAIGGWSPDFHAAWARAVKGRGMRYTPLNASAYATSVAGLFELLDGYDGQPIRIRTRCMLDQRTQTEDPEGEVQITFQAAFPAGVAGRVIGDGMPFWVRDVSKTPPWTPQYWLDGLNPDGAPMPSQPAEGASFVLRLRTRNMVPGTQLHLYAANAGQSHIDGSFYDAITSAAVEAGCTCVTRPYTDPELGEINPYYGGVITYTDAYSDDRPIRIPLRLREDKAETGAIQLDFISTVLREGDPARPLLVNAGVISLWIQDTSLPDTPTFWRIDARSDGSTIRYALTSPSGSSDASVTLASSGTEPPGWRAALEAAVAATPGIAISGDRLTSTPSWGKMLAWSVPHPAGAGGKHALRLSDPAPRGESVVVIEDACVYLAPPALPALPAFARGVNLSGGEFGSHLPGTYREDYAYPAEPHWEAARRYEAIDYHLDRGAAAIRLPIRWERITDAPFGALVSPGSMLVWNERADMERIDDIVAHVTGRGGLLLLDLHNGLTYGGDTVDARSATLPTGALSDVWCRLAARYVDNRRVMLGITNEPAQVGTRRIADIMQAVVSAVRARTGSLHRILVTGSHWSSADFFLTEANDEAFRDFIDPARNTLLEMHQYFDADASGYSGVCVYNGQARLAAVTAWARRTGWRLWLGEFGGGDPRVDTQSACADVVPAACRFMSDNRDVWVGWTAWGGGPRWPPTYALRLDPADYGATAETGPYALIRRFLGAD